MNLGSSLVNQMIVQSAAQDSQQRKIKMGQRWNAYFGHMDKPLKVRPGDADDNVRINYAGLAVNRAASALFGKDIDFVVAGADSLGDYDPETSADDWIEEALRENQGQILLQDIAISGAVCGNAYVKLIPAGAVGNPSDYPKLINLDPLTVDPVLDAMDCRSVVQWKIQWSAIDPATSQPAAYRQLITRNDDGKSWQIVDAYSTTGESTWITTNSEIWPYPWSHVFSCQNLPCPNQFHGVSDLETDILEAARATNLVASNMNRILRLHAHPKTFAKGLGAGTIDSSPDRITVLPGDESANVWNLEMQSDLSSSQNFLEYLRDSFCQVAGIPKISLGEYDGLGEISGLALKVLYLPLTQKIETKRRLYGAMLCDIAQRMLELSQHGKQRVSITWPSYLPEDLQSEAQAGLLLNQMGVSKSTLLERMGYNATAELARSAAERQAEGQDIGSIALQQFDRGGDMQGQ